VSTFAQTYPGQAFARESVSGDILAFAIPCLQFLKFNVVGILYASDLLLAITFLYFAFSGKLKLSTSLSRKFVVLCAIWLGSQVVTDLIVHSAFADYARGWSRIITTLVSFCVLYPLLYGRSLRLLLYGWGLVIGGTLELLIDPGQWGKDYPWKFGLCFPVTLVAFLVASRKSSTAYSAIILSTLIGLINIAAGTRSRGGVCLVVALYLLLSLPARQKCSIPHAFKGRSVLAIVGGIALAIVAVLWVYDRAANTGLLGGSAKEEYLQQSSGDYGVLLGGRSAILGSIPAILDSPILGHGSWARDPIYVLAQMQAMAEMGYENLSAVEEEELDEGYIPAHSYLFGAWVEAGLAGAVFWGWILIMALKIFFRAYPLSATLLPLAAFCALSLAWDVVFSPYGAQQRLIVPYYVLMLMTVLGVEGLKRSTGAVGADL